MNELERLYEDLRNIGSLSKKEKLALSSRIFNVLNSGGISQLQREKFLNEYRRLTYDLTNQEPSHYDPHINLENLGYKKLYQSGSHASDKIISTLNRLKKNDIVYKSDKIDLYNYLKFQKNNNKNFSKQLSETPEKLMQKYGYEKTTKSRYDYLLNNLEKILLREGPKPSKTKKVLRVSHDYNRNQGGLQENLQELNKGLTNRDDVEIYQVLPITKKQFSNLVEGGKISRDGDSFLDSYSGVTIKPIFIEQDESERMVRLNRASITKDYVEQFNKIFEEIDPDIVHVHNGYYKPHNQAARLAKSRGKGVIHTWHGGMIDPKNKNAKKRLKDIFDDTVKYSDKNFAISQAGKEEFNSDKVKIAYGVDLKNYDPKKIKPEDIRKKRDELGLNKDDYVFFFPGRYHEQKNQHGLIKAFKDVVNKNKNAKLLFAGQNFEDSEGRGYFSKIKELAKRNGLDDKIIFHDRIKKKDMPSFYALSDAVIYPSKNEGRGRSLIEAMAMGKPILASNDAGLKDSIKTDEGDVGYLFDPNKEKDISDKMNECIVNKKKSNDFAHKAKHHAHKNLSIESYVDKYYGAYHAN
ncbi:MAG: glycosyltransferase family 4 protein [Candidatus Woesearchaeota archaeon]